MSFIQIYKIYFFLLVVILPSLCAYAHDINSDQERVYLTQMLNQLNALQPLIMAAEKAQPADQRVKFHYHHYQDNQGHWHNGLLEDVQAIKAGVIQHLQAPTIEPRTISPLQGDYLSDKPVASNGLLASESSISSATLSAPEVSHDNGE